MWNDYLSIPPIPPTAETIHVSAVSAGQKITLPIKASPWPSWMISPEWNLVFQPEETRLIFHSSFLPNVEMLVADGLSVMVDFEEARAVLAELFSAKCIP